jgi:hypothetical protein
VDVATSEDGTKRVITRTGVYSGTELHLWLVPPHHDPRLPVRPDRPDLSFDAARREVATTEEWQQVGRALGSSAGAGASPPAGQLKDG